MKHLYLIGGTMGVGKTTVCQVLKQTLDKSVVLDGDWCWDMHPFVVNAETKSMVMENIAFLLQQYLKCSVFEHVIFCWVMHEQSIIDDLLSRLDLSDCTVHSISLLCSPEILAKRLQKDIDLGYRKPDILARSLLRLPLYEQLHTIRVNTDDLTPDEVAEKILCMIQQAK